MERSYDNNEQFYKVEPKGLEVQSKTCSAMFWKAREGQLTLALWWGHETVSLKGSSCPPLGGREICLALMEIVSNLTEKNQEWWNYLRHKAICFCLRKISCYWNSVWTWYICSWVFSAHIRKCWMGAVQFRWENSEALWEFSQSVLL